MDRKEKAKALRRIYDSQMTKELDTPTLVKTLETISTILSNIIKNPDEEKFRKVPDQNAKFQSTVLERKGGKSFIIQCGFSKKVIENREFWCISNEKLDIENLQVASELIEEKKTAFTSQMELEKKKWEIEKIENSKRSEVAKKAFEEDRATWKERLEMTGGTKESLAQPFRDLSEGQPRHGPGATPEVEGVRLGGDDDENV
eukprot:TRINITY_DN3136_c0_g1_i1.p1 TRINITY_DN3136_c0_g1~~TRINITY_DN3136_c0_g1_i1.p1  ORF type:complete len:202 (+),score=36.07 TRINITY_DN3136_c0_g1_i1:17-622(+)